MRVAVVGLGHLGWPVAANIVKAGHEVMVLDADPGRADRFAAEHRCRAAGGAGDLAGGDFVITVLPTGDIVRHVLVESDGGAFLAKVRPGTVVIDLGSSDPLGTRALGATLRARGASLIDAPVSKRAPSFVATATGATPGAATGTLVIMIGSDDKAAIERARPLLAVIGDRLFETGPLGTAHAVKTLNNYASAAAHVALAEAVLIGQRFGLDPALMIEIFNESTGRSFVSEVLFKNQYANEKFRTGFSVGLLAKDVKIATALAAAMNFNAPVARLTESRWADARDRLGADCDLTQVVPAWDENSQ